MTFKKGKNSKSIEFFEGFIDFLSLRSERSETDVILRQIIFHCFFSVFSDF